MTTSQGWAFAVGAGRRVDYRVIAAPDFLVDGLEYGVLGDIVHPAANAQRMEVVRTTTPIGGPLTIVYSTQVVTSQDIAGSEDSGSAAGDPHDEQNRPLRLIVGFVSRGDDELKPDAADVAAARIAALDAYRAFIADEVGFSVVPTAAFRLASRIAGRLESLPPTQSLSLVTSSRGMQQEGVSVGPRQVLAERSRPLAGPVGGQKPQPAPASTGSAGAARRHVGLLLGLIVALVGSLTLVVIWLWPNSTDCPIGPAAQTVVHSSPAPAAVSRPRTTRTIITRSAPVSPTLPSAGTRLEVSCG